MGEAALPVVVVDDFTDRCDPDLTRVYDPGPGPAYGDHGDWIVSVTASDTSANASSSHVSFTIDTVPPSVAIVKPTSGTILVPSNLPLGVVFTAADDDGATGRAVHEVMKLSDCAVYDGATYGDGDGLLSDEMIRLGIGELCRIATLCGFTSLNEPALSVEAKDCGGNVGVASVRLRGSLQFWPGLCGATAAGP